MGLCVLSSAIQSFHQIPQRGFGSPKDCYGGLWELKKELMLGWTLREGQEMLCRGLARGHLASVESKLGAGGQGTDKDLDREAPREPLPHLPTEPTL